MYPQDSLASVDVRPVDRDLPIEPAGPKQGRVQDLRPVAGRHDDDALGGVEAVHLHEELVERLLALVMAAEGTAHRTSARLPDGV